jgi:hypothetical protein
LDGDNRKSFWKNGISIDESRVSVLMVLLIIFSVSTLYMYFIDKEVDLYIVEITKVLIVSVAGVNAINLINNTEDDYDERV